MVKAEGFIPRKLTSLRQVVLRIGSVTALFAVSALSQPLHALVIHYDTSRSTAVRSCDALMYRGEDEQATECYAQLLATSEGLEQADAAAALGDIRQANRLYRDLAASSTDPAIKTHWGQLYLQTHQVSDAEALFREALLYDENLFACTRGTGSQSGRRLRRQGKRAAGGHTCGAPG